MFRLSVQRAEDPAGGVFLFVGLFFGLTVGLTAGVIVIGLFPGGLGFGVFGLGSGRRLLRIRGGIFRREILFGAEFFLRADLLAGRGRGILPAFDVGRRPFSLGGSAELSRRLRFYLDRKSVV